MTTSVTFFALELVLGSNDRPIIDVEAFREKVSGVNRGLLFQGESIVTHIEERLSTVHRILDELSESLEFRNPKVAAVVDQARAAIGRAFMAYRLSRPLESRR